MKNSKIIIRVIFIGSILIFIFSCSSQKKNLKENSFGNYIIVDSTKLESPGLWYGTGKKINNMLLAINRYTYRLELYSTSGQLLSYCGKYGKGPGEFTNPEFFDCNNNIIYLIDSGNNKIVIIELDEQKEELIYRDEFHLNSRPRDICAIGKDKILVSVFNDVNNIKLYNINGELLQEYSIPKKERFKNDKDIITSDCSVENCGDEHLLVGSIVNMRLYFCCFNNNDNSIQIIDEKSVRFHRRSKGIVDAGRRGIDIFGLNHILSSAENYYISFRSDMPEMKRIGETFFEVYDKDGDYLGNVFLQNKLANYIAFSSNADTLWFQELNNDSLLYMAKYVAERK